MDINLYINNSAKNKIGKNKNLVTTLQGNLKDNSSLLDPVITVQMNTITANYAYIPQFGRFYFINDIINIRNNIWELHMHVDVLETYQSQIRDTTCLVGRQENNYNLFLRDDKIPCVNDTVTETYRLKGNKSFNNQYASNVILINTGVANIKWGDNNG